MFFDKLSDPFSSQLNVLYTANIDNNVNITVSNIQGRTLRNESRAVTAGINHLSVDNVSGLQNGIYFVTIEVDGIRQTVKMVKQ